MPRFTKYSFILLLLLVVGLATTTGVLIYRSQTQSTLTTTNPTPTPTPLTATTVTPTTALTSHCLSSELQASQADAPGGGTAGSVYSELVLTNIGQRSCTVTGYPGVSLLDATNTQVGLPAERSTAQASTTITITPTQNVVSTVRVVQNNFEAGVCKTGATQLKVFPPDETAALTIPTTITTWCPGFSITTFSSQ